MTKHQYVVKFVIVPRGFYKNWTDCMQSELNLRLFATNDSALLFSTSPVQMLYVDWTGRITR